MIIDFQVTARCNMRCEFCCGAERLIEDSEISKIYKAIDKFEHLGVERVVLSGGEPFVRNDIVDIIKYIYSKNIPIYVSTNGILIEKYYTEIKGYVDCIGLPIDADNAGLVSKMTRSPKGFYEVIRLLQTINKEEKRPQIKIGTVVSKVNIDNVLAIGKLLFKTPGQLQPDVWRLYEFSPLRYGAGANMKYGIEPRDFLKIVKAVKREFPDKKISELTNDDSDNSYIFLTPDLRVEVLVGNEYLDLGNINEVDLNLLKSKINNPVIQIRSKKNREWVGK